MVAMQRGGRELTKGGEGGRKKEKARPIFNHLIFLCLPEKGGGGGQRRRCRGVSRLDHGAPKFGGGGEGKRSLERKTVALALCGRNARPKGREGKIERRKTR